MRERKCRRRREAEVKKLRDSITAIQNDLGRAYMGFNTETDPELTEAYIYEISALRARYDHAFQSLKDFFR